MSIILFKSRNSTEKGDGGRDGSGWHIKYDLKPNLSMSYVVANMNSREANRSSLGLRSGKGS